MATVTTIKDNGSTEVKSFNNFVDAQHYYTDIKDDGNIHALQH